MQTITATEILYGRTIAATLRQSTELPTHPALALIMWEEERDDIHTLGVGLDADGHYWQCSCRPGFRVNVRTEFRPGLTPFEASAAVISHALNTCAACGNDKPAQAVDGRMDVFPRCSGCAF